MDEKVTQLISYAQSSLYFANEAFNELWHITQTPNTKEEYDIVAGNPFGFYGITLQYCFIMEYNKLLDVNTSKENENVASLLRLNKKAKEILGDVFESKFLDNIKLLKEITNSELYKRLKKLRNKKFGHSDSDLINNPWKVEGFTGQQIDGMRNQIQVLLIVFNNILAEISDANFWLHNNDQTANFIRYHSKYKEFYYRNFKKEVGDDFIKS